MFHLGLTIVDPKFSELTAIQQAHITVKSQNVPDNAIRKVLLHELGHALGLLHTQQKNDIMYGNLLPTPEEKQRILGNSLYQPRLSTGDIKALKEKYPSSK